MPLLILAINLEWPICMPTCAPPPTIQDIDSSIECQPANRLSNQVVAGQAHFVGLSTWTVEIIAPF